MANDTLNQNVLSEKSIHDIFFDIDIHLIVLKEKLYELSKRLAKDREQSDKFSEIIKYISDLNIIQQQMNYYDEIIKDEEVQQANKPIVI